MKKITTALVFFLATLLGMTASAEGVLHINEAAPPPRARTTLTHNFTGSNALVIPAASTYDYILTGTYNADGHGVTVGLGYKGTITLNNVSITTTGDTSCILLQGGTGNLPTQTDVVLVISGNNVTWGNKGTTGNWTIERYAGIHISAGTKLTIRGTGSLTSYMNSSPSNGSGGQPAIGAAFVGYEWTGGGDTGKPVTEHAGGDLIIESGTVTAIGSFHSAGIGSGCTGGLRNIVITGGNITSTGGGHGYGIGEGCYRQTVGSLVVLPPAKVTASGRHTSGDYGVGGLGGMSVFYMGDPNQKKIRVSAQQFRGTALTGRQNVNVLFDVSGDSTIAAALRLANLDPTRWYAGTTGTQGYWETTGKIAGNVKVYSDTPTPEGQVYSSKKVSVPGTADVHIIIDDPDMSTPWLQVTQNVTNWTNGSVVLTAKLNPAVTNLVRIRQKDSTWQSVSSITKTVTSNGTHYFEAENEDGNTMTISHTVTNIDKGTPTINVS